MLKPKIAFVLPRYGLEINGGAELLARQIAERLIPFYQVEVLTTCAIDYMTWADEYPNKETIIEGVLVKRFKVDNTRNVNKFNEISSKVLTSKCSVEEEKYWMTQQGPVCSKLIQYLEDHIDNYQAVVFQPYLYTTTFEGLKVCPAKSILQSDAHDERPIYLSIFKEMFQLPAAMIYNTTEEQEFVHKMFQNEEKPFIITGAGVDIPDIEECISFKEKYRIEGNYILYVGRVDESKGCGELFDFFIRYHQEIDNATKLVIIGKEVMKIPHHKNIIHVGFIPEEDKFLAIKESKALVLASRFESLSIVVLESFAMKRPVLLSGYCDVLRGHCVKSNGGFYYMNYEEFSAMLQLLMKDDELNERMGRNGSIYVNDNFQWKVIIDKIRSLIELVSEKNKVQCN
jgi:glycosyltransferase involved in cell wall biosynthesis